MSNTTVTKRNFSLTETRYDQKTFLGRIRHFVAFTNPFNLFVSDEQLKEMNNKLAQFKEGTLPDSVSEEELWKAKYVVTSTYARDGEKIPWPCRMSGYALGNLPISVGMMLPNASLPVSVFWQWANQTQNALTNHYNRSGEQSLSNEKLLGSYLGAVTAAVSIAVGSKLAIRQLSPSAQNSLGKLVPFLSAASANVVNTYLMRRHEMESGISVMDENRNVVGTSSVAAKKAITATCMSRVFMSFSLLAIPPFIYPLFERTAFLKARPRLSLPMQFGVVGTLIFTVIPLSVALFSQEMEVKSDQLEPKFAQQFPNKTLIFNKGL